MSGQSKMSSLSSLFKQKTLCGGISFGKKMGMNIEYEKEYLHYYPLDKEYKVVTDGLKTNIYLKACNLKIAERDRCASCETLQDQHKNKIKHWKVCC